MNYYDAMIVGSGFSGLGTALILAKKGLSSLILEREDHPGGLLKGICRGDHRLKPLLEMVESNLRIDLITGAKLRSIGGFHPRFNIQWVKDGRALTADAGHIVIASGLNLYFPEHLHPAGPGPGIITLPELEHHVCTTDWSEFKDKRLLMICGYNEPNSAYGIQLTLDRSIALAKAGASVFLAMPDVLFNDPEVVDMYRAARNAGVLIIRSPEAPVLSGQHPDLSFEAIDPSIVEDHHAAIIHGSIDIVVFEPEYRPRTLENIFWSPLKPSTNNQGFYQPDNPTLTPVLSERKGVYFVGAVTGFKSLESCRQEAALASAEISIKHPENPTHAEVDENKCVACLTCVRICPHRAIHIDGTARVAREACDGCGICAAECPAKAITMVKEGESFERSDLVESPEHIPNWMVLFCCDGSTGPTWDSMKPNPVLKRWHMNAIRVACSGQISVSAILEHFKKGSSAVLVAACPKSCCDHIHGNQLADNRVKRVKRILKSLKIDPAKVEIINVGRGMKEKLAGEIDDFCAHNEIGEKSMDE